MNPTNEYALVTGASSGIGKEMALELASRGYTPILVARTTSKLEELAKLIEDRFSIKAVVHSLDLTADNAAQQLFDSLDAEHRDNTTILVNNAGFGEYGQFLKTDWERENQMMQLNMRCLTQLTKVFLPVLVAHPSTCRVMNVASTAAFQPGPGMAVYFATKAYVLSFSEAIRAELAEKGITVTTLCPGYTESGFAEAAQMETSPLVSGNAPTSAEVALFGVNAMLEGKSVVVHGLQNSLLVEMQRFLPRRMLPGIVQKVLGS